MLQGWVLYSILYTLYSLFYTLYSVLCTLYTVLYTLYFQLYSLYSALNTLYSILYAPYSTCCSKVYFMGCSPKVILSHIYPNEKFLVLNKSYSITSTLCYKDGFYTLYTILYTLYSILCTLYVSAQK
jgi:hypothetical protein